MAGGVYDYFHEHGIRVGEDISVVGFDNQELAQYCHPGLTTMKIGLAEIGAEAAGILVEKLESESDDSRPARVLEKRVLCSLVERESVKRI